MWCSQQAFHCQLSSALAACSLRTFIKQHLSSGIQHSHPCQNLQRKAAPRPEIIICALILALVSLENLHYGPTDGACLLVLRIKCAKLELPVPAFAKIQSAVVALAGLPLWMLIIGSYVIYECEGVYKTWKYNYVLNFYKRKPVTSK